MYCSFELPLTKMIALRLEFVIVVDSLTPCPHNYCLQSGGIRTRKLTLESHYFLQFLKLLELMNLVEFSDSFACFQNVFV